MEVSVNKKSKIPVSLGKETSAIVLFLGMIALWGLVVIRDVVGISYSKLIFVGVASAVGIWLTYSDLIAFFALLIPMSCGLPNNYYFMILTLLLIVKKGKFNVLQISIPLIVIAQECLLTLFTPSFLFLRTLAYCADVLMVFFIILDDYDEKVNAKKVLKYFLYGASFTLIMVFLLSVKEHTLAKILTGAHRIGYTKEMTDETLKFSTNANTIGFYALMCSSVCLYFLSQNTRHKSGYLALFCVDSAIGFFSVSRSYMLFWAFILAIYFFKTFKLNTKGIIFLCGAALVLCVGGYILYTKTDLLDAYLGRFSQENVSTAGGRTELLVQYFQWQIARPLRFLFGTGASYYLYVVDIPESLHNGTQQIVFCYGIFGAVVFAYAFYKAWKKAAGNKKVSIYALLPLLALALFVQTVQFLAPHEYFMSIIVCFYAIRGGRNERTRQR